MRTVLLAISLLFINASFSQPVAVRLAHAIRELEKDSQFLHASIGLYVVDMKSGNTVFEKNAQTGLVPASCLKIITSAAAFDILGEDYRYKTAIKIKQLKDSFYLTVEGSGDPALGSSRWPNTNMQTVYEKINTALAMRGIPTEKVVAKVTENRFAYMPIPNGWVWEDIGNYFGAGARAFNWNENKYDLLLRSGNAEGDATELIGVDPVSVKMQIINQVRTGKKGSGDLSLIFSSPFSNHAFANGTIPPAQNKFVISGSMPDPSAVFIEGLKDIQQRQSEKQETGKSVLQERFKSVAADSVLISFFSPSLDSINYWFLRKSINLFGEAFVKTIALEKTGWGSTETGVQIIRDYFEAQGIDAASINMKDGSGLSPYNRVTPVALVKILQYAKKRPWFGSFKSALPEMNGIKMKSGYISGVRSYTGYVSSREGMEYTFAIIVNNIDGNAGTAREKIWRILDILK